MRGPGRKVLERRRNAIGGAVAIGLQALATAAAAQTPAPPAAAPPAIAPPVIAPPAIAPPAAEPPASRTVERSAKGASGKAIQVGVYLNVQPDCSSGPLPSIRLVSPPGNGTVAIKRGNITATNYKQCLALQVPGFIAFYQSKADFAGTDTVTLEVKFPQGRTELQRITINVGTGAAGQKI